MSRKDTGSTERKLRIFLSYAHEDGTIVSQLYDRLRADGFDPWMDKRDLLPGQSWQREIMRAVRESDVFLACVSSRYATKSGYTSREINFALDIAEEKPEGTIFIIPVRLEDIPVPDRLHDWHWCNYFEEDGHEVLMDALRVLAAQLGISTPATAGYVRPLPTSIQRDDYFDRYESGLKVLLERLGANHPRYGETLTYEQRLRENIRTVELFGDSESRRQERANVIVLLNELTRSILGVSFNDLCVLGVGALEPEKVWQEWEQEIRSRLLLYGEVIPEELRRIPADYRVQALRRYAETYGETQALEDYTGDSLRLLNNDLLQRWNEAWHDTEEALGKNPGIARTGRVAVGNLAQVVSEVLGLNIKECCDYQAVCAYMVEAPALRLRLPSCFPLIFVADPRPGSNTITMLVDTIDVLHTGYFALVIPLEPRKPTVDIVKELRQTVKLSPHVHDFIVLSQENVLDMFIARNPMHELTKHILDQVDLSVISPFVISGPVPETMFFGREAEIKLLVENAGKADFAIVGNRKIGKTSLLQRAFKRMEESGRVYPVSINCQTVRTSIDFFAAFQAATGIEQLPTTPKELSIAIRDLCHSRGKTPVFLMDEVDQLLADDAVQGELLAAEWRALAQEGICRFIFCGSTGLALQLENPRSAFFNFPQKLSLCYLNAETARMVVTQPLETLGVTMDDKETIIKGIVELTSGHPNLVQYLGRELVNATNRRHERHILVSDLEEIRISSDFTDYYLSTLWGEAGPLEKLITLVAPPDGFRIKSSYECTNNHSIFHWFVKVRNAISRLVMPTFRIGDIEQALRNYGIEVHNNDLDRALKLLCVYSVLEKRHKTYSFVPRSFYTILHDTQEVERLITNEKEHLMKGTT